MVELPLDRRNIVEDVGMIELKIIQYGGPRSVMNELRALVEESGVVLVRLDDKDIARRMASGNRKIEWHAADEESRRPA